MKRFLSSCIVALMVVSMLPTTGLAQTPAAAATPDPFALPVNLRIIRIREGNGFDFARLGPGSLARVNQYLIDDGQILTETSPSLREWFTELRIEDMYISYVILAPEGEAAADAGITVDIRLITFPDGASAEAMVPASIDILNEQAEEDPNASQDISAMEDLPQHEQVITGVTGMDPSFDVQTGAQGLFRVPFTRFIAQDGTIVASVKVTSLDPAFNDAAARELLAAQLECLAADVFCDPVRLPGGIDYAPATPTASPVAVTSPVRR